MVDRKIISQRLNTMNYFIWTLKEEVLYLQFVLKRNFSLITRLEEKTKDQWVIYIPVRQTIRLKDIVAPYMHESMLYKI